MSLSDALNLGVQQKLDSYTLAFVRAKLRSVMFEVYEYLAKLQEVRNFGAIQFDEKELASIERDRKRLVAILDCEQYIKKRSWGYVFNPEFLKLESDVVVTDLRGKNVFVLTSKDYGILGPSIP